MMSGGFTVLTGDVGLGKTLLCRYLLRHLPAGVRTAYVYNPQQTFVELQDVAETGLHARLPFTCLLGRSHEVAEVHTPDVSHAERRLPLPEPP